MKKMVGKICVLLAIGAAYAVWVRATSLAVPCLFRKITGWLCPGCGITTLFLCLLKLDFRGAFQANPFLFVTGPALLAEIVYYDWIRTRGRKLPAWNNILLVLYIAALCVFGVLRNVL